MIDAIIIVIIVIAIVSVIKYLCKEKRKGNFCIGCSSAGGCGGNCHSCNQAEGKDKAK